ncbi:xanthine dehydrogenase family protein subunit M [candidate division KSB1 bacterium]|nr:xanthine dehydrogenase family protein subunit M [candidate division KSB1 bacterium]
MISNITVQTPRTLHEAYELLQKQQGHIKILAGGTDLMVTLNARVEVHPAYLNIWPLRELRGISEVGNVIRIGALTTYTQIIRASLVQQHARILIEAAKSVGAAQIQNRGTMGGNIVNASPAGDTLPVLAVLEAELEIGSVRGIRKIPFSQFYTGYRKTVLAAEELLLAVHVPKPHANDWQYFRKVGTRQAQAISKVVLALFARVDAAKRIEAMRIAYGSVAPTVMRTSQTESLLNGQVLSEVLIQQAQQQVMREVQPISDVRSTAEYRRLISGNILARSLYELLASTLP